MTEQELQAIEARVAAATEGPWIDLPHNVWSVDIHVTPDLPGTEGGRLIATVATNRPAGGGTATFIAHARTDVPALVQEVRRLRELVQVAEWSASENLGGNGGFLCPWCGNGDGIGGHERHTSECPAFSANGVVR